MIELYLMVIAIGYIVAISVYFFNIRYMTIKETDIRSTQFELYKLRDDIIKLIAEEKLNREDECFRFVYWIINSSIGIIRIFTFKNLLNAATSSDKKIKRKIKTLIVEIFERNNGLSDILIEYCDIMIKALIRFSPSVRIYLSIKKKFFPSGLGNKKRKQLAHMPIIKIPVKTYTVTKDFLAYKAEFSTMA